MGLSKWHRTVSYSNGEQIVIIGIPLDDEATPDELQHNCDVMGCSSIEHVIARYDLPPLTQPSYDKKPDANDSQMKLPW